MISDTIKDLCIKKDMSIAQLERELGFGNGSIRRWDKNSPSIDKVVKVADYFSVPSDYLIYNIDENTVGGRLKKIRYSKEVFQRELADAIGVGITTILLLEQNEKEPDIDLLNKLSSYFEVDIEYFTMGKGVENINITFKENKGYTNQVEKNLSEAYSLLEEHSDRLDDKQRDDLTQLIKWYLDKELKIL